ncbi:hybrid sensor histidine kinase/response regulator [Flectobacillus sp. BAB-3569]|uniref:hybrid sensor histidine kinase/response regulator n=1 Tax=Flectobacillus sp. BAB-3569 TaxID=1509483 RepID=UPI000BA490C4|nr:hybrid sensor histidine kinase/response regulator [Flectobacillus sp. BAB-3569]PAC30672.1 hybrid sensor histidine kinase/response regulator [Flectobacillus sp. BAB-3569]
MLSRSNIKLLLVDDDEDDYFLTCDYLKQIPGQNIEVTWAKSFSMAISKLTQIKFDICFFDFRLGAKTGLDLLRIVKEHRISTPMVMLTGKGHKEIDEEAMKLGAMDYLIKGELDTEKIERCIRYSLERAQTLQTLRESEAQYKSIFDNIQQAIVLTSPVDGSFLYFNPEVSVLTGYSPEELRNMTTISMFGSNASRQNFATQLAQYGQLDNYETWLTTKSGEKKLCQINAFKRTDSNGLEHFLGVVRDITHVRKAEKEHVISEKVAATGRLIRTLAHEVRNPLTNINLSLDQLASELEDEELHFFLEIIQRNSKRIGDLISELLNSYRPAAVSLNMYSGSLVIEESIQQAIDRLNLKNIQLKKDLSIDTLLQIDAEQIKIALLNIVINAVEAMETGNGILEVKSTVRGSSYLISIKDNGMGMSSEQIDRLFEPYFTSKSTGLGLGLSATLNIIQAHKGSIEVESTLGEGSQFIISLPIPQQVA